MTFAQRCDSDCLQADKHEQGSYNNVQVCTLVCRGCVDSEHFRNGIASGGSVSCTTKEGYITS